MKAVMVGVQEFQAELQKRELEIAALKTKVDDILKGHTEDSPGYKELKKQKRRLGMLSYTNLTPLVFTLSSYYHHHHPFIRH